jgi:hypothetical protein
MPPMKIEPHSRNCSSQSRLCVCVCVCVCVCGLCGCVKSEAPKEKVPWWTVVFPIGHLELGEDLGSAAWLL